MKNALIIVGRYLKYNYAFIEYLKREAAKSLGCVELICFIDKSDNDIFRVIEDATKSYENIIIATENGFNLVGRVLSTLTEDNLTYKKEMLVPSKALELVADSYKIKCKKSLVNILQIDVLNSLPKILLECKTKRVSFLFFKHGEQKAELLRFITLFEYEFDYTCMIEGLGFYNLYVKSNEKIEKFLKKISEHFKDSILITDDLSSLIVQRLIEGGKTITCAESCTGGLIVSELVKNSGVSAVLKGSVVTYANESKTKLIGVKEQTLQRYGAVSRQCLHQMLDGVLESFDADFAIAVSGVAGPDGGSREKPVGTVYVGVKTRENVIIIKKLRLKGDRQQIQQSTVLWVFKLLVESDKKLFFKIMPFSLDK